ncbi:hypothetical protein [Streptomyces microflavus]|uniref:hypothetical protein n=1 Tax=Streptomyces microflavus TaxID=1919 RepID=UPI003B21E049
MLKERTAAELADALDGMQHHQHNTGGLSMLDEATLEFGWRYPSIGPAQEAFAKARHLHKRSYRTEVGNYSDESWQDAMDAARQLAEALRPLGETRIPRCKERTGWGTCGIGLKDDGTCPATDEHRTTEQ